MTRRCLVSVRYEGGLLFLALMLILGLATAPAFGLVSLVSVSARNWCYSCETVERVAKCDLVEITSIHAGFAHITENMLGWRKSQGEYPTLDTRETRECAVACPTWEYENLTPAAPSVTPNYQRFQ
jgi:hypothetical protein